MGLGINSAAGNYFGSRTSAFLAPANLAWRGFIDGYVQRRKHPFNGLSKRERGLRKEKGAFEKGVGPYIIEISKNIFVS